MKICILTANLGGFDKIIDPVPQSISCDFFRFTDHNFPPREGAMTPRLQARITKVFGWQMVPGYDLYVWVDSSCAIENPDTVKWLLNQLGSNDIAMFKHPNRNSIQAEGDYINRRLSKGCPYITPRYKNELIEEQMKEINNDKGFVDNKLFASTVLIYRNNEKVHSLMREWWYGISRYHQVDQMWLPYALYKTGCSFSTIDADYQHNEYLTYVRNKK